LHRTERLSKRSRHVPRRPRCRGDRLPRGRLDSESPMNPTPVAVTPQVDLLALARRLELAEALAGVEYAATLRRTGGFPEATSLAVGGGYATFAGAVSPLTQAFALGLHGALP